MRINNNIMAINTHRQYGINNAKIAGSTEKLSSGYRINRAGDDAAGLAISEKMRAQIRGLNMASKNSQDAISLVQTAEGALQESHNILQRMRELAVQSASDTNETSVDRDALNKEFQQLIKELNDTARTAKFNDQGLIDGSFAQKITAASSDGSAHNLAWANGNKVEAGSYAITVTSIIVVPSYSGAASTSTLSQSFSIASNAKNTAVSITWTAASGVHSDQINGIWRFSIAEGVVSATNERTGEIRTRLMIGVSGGASAAINFGDLGTLTIYNTGGSGIAAADSFIAMSGEILIEKGVSAKEAEYRHVARLDGIDEVELKTGMSVLNFKNAGISVGLNNAIAVNNFTSTAMTSLQGTVTVTKVSGKSLVIQTGANQGDELAINIDKMDAYTLGVAATNIGNRVDASTAITQVNSAVNLVSTQRAALGALQNRLNHKIANLDTSAENLQAAESRIRDVDMAKEMTTFTKNNILFQASMAMLAQANAAPQGVLQLLG